MRRRRAEIESDQAVAALLGVYTVDFSFLLTTPDLCTLDILQNFLVIECASLCQSISAFFFFSYDCDVSWTMSAKSEVPDAWDDDWESQADVGDISGLCQY